MKRATLFVLSLIGVFALFGTDAVHAFASAGSHAAEHAEGLGWCAALGALAFGACMTAGAQSPELGSALDVCGQCPAMPEPRDWKLIDQMTKARGVYPTGEATVQWNGLAPQDVRSRYCGIKSIKLSGSVFLTSAGGNSPVTPYQMRGFFTQMFLSDAGGHAYFAQINGRSVVDDYWFRHYRTPYVLEGAVPGNLAPGVYQFRFDLEIALVGRYPGASPIEGLLNLAALQQTDGSQGMRFTMNGFIPGNPAGLSLGNNPGNPNNVVFVRDDGQEGIDVWVEYTYTDQPVIDAPWSLREYTIAETNGTLKRPKEKTEYAVVRYFPEDAPLGLGQQLAAGIDNIVLQAAGTTFAQQRRIDMVRRQAFLEISAPESAAALGLPQLGLPNEPGVTQGYLMLCPQRPRETAPAGPIVFNFATQPAPNARYLHRTCACDTSDRAAKILAAIKCGPATCYQASNPLGANGQPTLGVSDSTAPKVVIPLATNNVQ